VNESQSLVAKRLHEKKKGLGGTPEVDMYTHTRTYEILQVYTYEINMPQNWVNDGKIFVKECFGSAAEFVTVHMCKYMSEA